MALARGFHVYRHMGPYKTYFHSFSPAADIDECAEGLASCGAHAQCLNLPGSHRCQCQSGFEFAFDGRTCVGKFHRATGIEGYRATTRQYILGKMVQLCNDPQHQCTGWLLSCMAPNNLNIWKRPSYLAK